MAGCGSGGATSAQSQNPAAAAAPASAPAQAPATTTTDNGPDTSNVKLAGTAVESNTGVQVTEVSKFGPLQYATQAGVPHAYFAACNQDYGTLTSTSGFAVVDLTLTEDTGS